MKREQSIDGLQHAAAFDMAREAIQELGATMPLDKRAQLTHGLYDTLKQHLERYEEQAAQQRGRLYGTASTMNLMLCAQLNVWPRPADRVNFAIDTREHFEALATAIRAGEIMAPQLESAMCDGRKLTALVRAAPSNPHKDITFATDDELFLTEDRVTRREPAIHREMHPVNDNDRGR